LARLDRGGWTIESDDAALLEPALALAERQHVQLRETSGPARFGEIDCWYKHDRWRWKTRWRYALKRLVLLPYPRRAERDNLLWLRQRCFLAAEPLVVGEHRHAGLVDYGFLITRREQDALPLEQKLAESDAAERGELIEELAREVARMHALRFVHRDLHARNLLVRPSGSPGRIVFLDCWAGGAGPGWRGTAYDLACLDSEAQRLLSPKEREQLASIYSEELQAQLHGSNPGR
jgi:hypothetical protein